MYKFIMPCIFGTMLSACSSNVTHSVEEKSVHEKEEHQTVVEKDKVSENKSSITEHKESIQADQYPASLVEYKKIIEVIDHNDYTFQIVTDNEGKRILILTNSNGEKIYKTVFIKHENRLKVIKVNGSDEVFNDIIQ